MEQHQHISITEIRHRLEDTAKRTQQLADKLGKGGRPPNDKEMSMITSAFLPEFKELQEMQMFCWMAGNKVPKYNTERLEALFNLTKPRNW